MRYDASLLSLLTIQTEIGEEIILAYLKELNEIAPPDIYWYPDKGQDGKAEWLWNEKKIRQWLLIGTDESVQVIWSSLQTKYRFMANWEVPREVLFIMAPAIPAEETNQVTQIVGVPLCNPGPILYKQVDYSPLASFLINEKSNCNFIEGSQYHSTIKALTPASLLSENSLFSYLKEKVVAVYQRRSLFYHLEEKTEPGGRKIVSGFIQRDQEFRRSHYVVIRAIEGTTTIGTSDIVEATGQWEVELGINDGQGQFLLIHRDSGEAAYGEKYYILRNVNFQTNIVHTVITDLYGREIPLAEGDRKEIFAPIESVSWDANLYPDSRQAELELCDKIIQVLLSLGSTIVISDPYFMGDVRDVREKDGRVEFTSRSQVIFLNALLTAIGKGQLKSITLIGYWQRAKDFTEGEKETLVAKYKLIAALIARTFINYSGAKLEYFDMVFSKRSFHDRYWLSTVPGDSPCYHVSNSVNGPFEQKEFSIRLQQGIDAFKERTKILNRLADGETENLLE